MGLHKPSSFGCCSSVPSAKPQGNGMNCPRWAISRRLGSTEARQTQETCIGCLQGEGAEVARPLEVQAPGFHSSKQAQASTQQGAGGGTKTDRLRVDRAAKALRSVEPQGEGCGSRGRQDQGHSCSQPHSSHYAKIP